MIISHSKKWAVFEPWKCASSTLFARLSVHDESRSSRSYHFNPYLNRVVHHHITCADFVALPEGRLGYDTFTFVRNPYDRCYSGFSQLRKALVNQSKWQFEQPWIKSLVSAQLAEIERELAVARGDFDTWLLAVREEQVFEIGRNTTFVLHPAHYWTHIGGERYVDWIGKVENFETDFAFLCNRLDIPAPLPQNANVTAELPPVGRYRYAGRIGREALDRINALFASDFDYFGYERI